MKKTQVFDLSVVCFLTLIAFVSYSIVHSHDMPILVCSALESHLTNFTIRYHFFRMNRIKMPVYV